MQSVTTQGSQKQETPQEFAPFEERLALRWASLLSGQSGSTGHNLNAAESRIVAWASTHLGDAPGPYPGGQPAVLEPFMTTRFVGAAGSIQANLEHIRQVLQQLQKGEVDFVTSMTRISQFFQGDESRLLGWRTLVNDLPRFRRWLPAFESACRYLSNAFPTPLEDVEECKKALLSSLADPQKFLDPPTRDQFDRDYSGFKQSYIDYYHAAHDANLHIVGNQKMESRLDAVALRNLELLSDLEGAERSYLNRARAIGKWVQAQQCDLPVREILDHHPRCYCNFNPVGRRHLSQSVDQMVGIIRQGIDQFRSALRKARIVIIQELKAAGIDDAHSRPIAALMSRGPMLPLKPHSIDILSEIMRKHPKAFSTFANLRPAKPQAQTSRGRD